MNVSLLLQWCLLKFIRSRQRTFQSALEECGCFHLKPMHICYAAVLGKNFKYKCISHILSSVCTQRKFGSFGATRTLSRTGQLTKQSNRGEHVFRDVTTTHSWSSPEGHPGLKPRVRGWRWDSLLKRPCIKGPQRITKSRFEQKAGISLLFIWLSYNFIFIFFIFSLFFVGAQKMKKKKTFKTAALRLLWDIYTGSSFVHFGTI